MVLTPPHTTIDTPLETPITLGDSRLTRVQVRIPPGPSGLVGFLVTFNGISLVPWANKVTWLIGTDEHFDVPVGIEVTRFVSIQSYNLDYLPHHLYFRFTYTPMSLLQETNIAIVAPAMLG